MKSFAQIVRVVLLTAGLYSMANVLFLSDVVADNWEVERVE